MCGVTLFHKTVHAARGLECDRGANNDELARAEAGDVQCIDPIATLQSIVHPLRHFEVFERHGWFASEGRKNVCSRQPSCRRRVRYDAGGKVGFLLSS